MQAVALGTHASTWLLSQEVVRSGSIKLAAMRLVLYNDEIALVAAKGSYRIWQFVI
jgi:hypothetical protein